MLQGHPDMNKVPGVEMSTGSLGQGFSVACGMAMGSKLDNAPWNVYALLGDGEIQEGIVWEAAMSASHYKLDNLIVFLDHNKKRNGIPFLLLFCSLHLLAACRTCKCKGCCKVIFGRRFIAYAKWRLYASMALSMACSAALRPSKPSTTVFFPSRVL